MFHISFQYCFGAGRLRWRFCSTGETGGPALVVVGQMVAVEAETFAIVKLFGVLAGPCELFRLG